MGNFKENKNSDHQGSISIPSLQGCLENLSITDWLTQLNL